MSRKIELDGEAADRITVLNLQDYRAYLKKELAQWKKNPRTDSNPDGYWLHPEDVVGNMKRIKRIDKILEDFGGELYGECKAGESNQESSMVEAPQKK